MLLKGTEKKKGRKRGSVKKNESVWYRPSVRDVYA